MPSLEEVKAVLAAHGVEVWQYQQPTPTVETAAAAVGCSPAEIAKSLVFIVGGQPLLVVASGDMKVKSSLLKRAANLSGKVLLPDADQVYALTGYAPGGVCPFLLPDDLPVYLDHSLKRFARVYAAAGNAASAVPIDAETLERMTAGSWVEVCEVAVV